MSIADIREAMADALDSIDGIRSFPYMTDDIVPPVALFDFEIDPDMTFANGSHLYTFTITVWTSRNDNRASQKLLDLLRDPSSATGVKQTLQESAGLQAVVDDLRVTSIGVVNISNAGTSEYLTVDFEVEVIV